MRRLVPVLVLLAVGTAAILRIVGVGVLIPSSPALSGTHSANGLALAPASATSEPPPTATLDPQAPAEVELPMVDVPPDVPPNLLGQLGDVLRARAAATAAASAAAAPPEEESPLPAPASTVKPASTSAPPLRIAPTATVAPPPPPVNLSGLAQQLFAAQNDARSLNGVAPLTVDAAVTAVAQARAQDMATRGYFSHTSPTGETAFTLLAAAGIGYKLAGENIGENNYPDDQSVTVAMTGFLSSSTHRANLLNPAFTRVGIGVVVAGDLKYFVIVFVG